MWRENAALLARPHGEQARLRARGRMDASFGGRMIRGTKAVGRCQRAEPRTCIADSLSGCSRRLLWLLCTAAASPPRHQFLGDMRCD